MERTIRWAATARDYWAANPLSEYGDRQQLFGIVQGSTYADLRRECARRLAALDFPGYAIGGLSVGEPGDLYREMTAVTARRLPADRPALHEGVGSPGEILDAVACGEDMSIVSCPRVSRAMARSTLRRGGSISSSEQYSRSDFSAGSGLRLLCLPTYTRAYLRHLSR
jgi:queuine tRNA-ribosyltransferase